jgi:predicted transcriptional regulator
MLLQVALLDQNDLLEATLDFAKFQTEEARAIAKIGLANYFAVAALMPYARLSNRGLWVKHFFTGTSPKWAAFFVFLGSRAYVACPPVRGQGCLRSRACTAAS